MPSSTRLPLRPFLAVAHGGQILLTQTTCDLVRDALPEQIESAAIGAKGVAGSKKS